MRLLFRLTGTWLLALALILIIIDGTKSLGANAFVWTPMGELWMQIHKPSLDGFMSFIESRFFDVVLKPAADFILRLPAWAVFGVPGIVLAIMGRSRRSRLFVHQDQY
jgi:hypothetical protein